MVKVVTKASQTQNSKRQRNQNGGTMITISKSIPTHPKLKWKWTRMSLRVFWYIMVMILWHIVSILNQRCGTRRNLWRKHKKFLVKVSWRMILLFSNYKLIPMTTTVKNCRIWIILKILIRKVKTTIVRMMLFHQRRQKTTCQSWTVLVWSKCDTKEHQRTWGARKETWY